MVGVQLSRYKRNLKGRRKSKALNNPVSHLHTHSTFHSSLLTMFTAGLLFATLFVFAPTRAMARPMPYAHEVDNRAFSGPQGPPCTVRNFLISLNSPILNYDHMSYRTLLSATNTLGASGRGAGPAAGGAPSTTRATRSPGPLFCTPSLMVSPFKVVMAGLLGAAGMAATAATRMAEMLRLLAHQATAPAGQFLWAGTRSSSRTDKSFPSTVLRTTGALKPAATLVLPNIYSGGPDAAPDASLGRDEHSLPLLSCTTV